MNVGGTQWAKSDFFFQFKKNGFWDNFTNIRTETWNNLFIALIFQLLFIGPL